MSRCPTITECLYMQAVENSELCDVTLTFGDHMMRAHWGVLIQCPFFGAMFNSGMKEKQEGTIHINDDFDGGLEVLLRYLYTSTATLNLSNVHGVLCAADYFQMNSLIELCETYLFEVEWTPENCIDIYYIANRFRLGFCNKLMEYLTKDFLKILEFDDNGQYVTSDMMLEIAGHLGQTKTEGSNNGLSQEMMFRYFRKWLNCNVSERRDTFSSLLLKLRLEDTSHAFFQSLASDYIQNFTECREHYNKIRRASMPSQIKHDDNLSDAVLVVAEDGYENFCIFGYKTDVNIWSYLGKTPHMLDDWCGGKGLIAVNEIDNCIYVCGKKTISQNG